jgi:hypothetical protein
MIDLLAMARKPKMTVTGRFVDESRPLAARRVRSPFPNPPPNRRPIARLGFHAPTPKVSCRSEDLARAIRVAALPDAVLFVDTNIFTKELDALVWDALFTRRICITPGVMLELMPWLKNPFANKAARDRVLAALRSALALEMSGNPGLLQSDTPKIELLPVGQEFEEHGYEYYFNLLRLRKAFGPLAKAVLTKNLGRPPTNDELVAELQHNFGERGFRIARKGIEAAASPNKLTDEQLVVMAVLSAIIRGKEVFILTRDADLLEQYFKILCLMKEHYRAMLVADRYIANPEEMPFREVPIQNDGIHVPAFSGEKILQLETTDLEFNPLPQTFHFATIYCFVLHGEGGNMKLTSCSFCAETEMAQVLRVKKTTGGLSSDKLNGRNCVVHTVPVAPDNHGVIVSIGKETVVPFGHLGTFRFDDFCNALFENEQGTALSW